MTSNYTLPFDSVSMSIRINFVIQHIVEYNSKNIYCC